MTREVAIRCRCGSLRGVARDVSLGTTCRCSCYCGDCRAFVHFLERPDVLDAAGGVELLQIARSSVRIENQSELACLRLSPKGMFRWYAACCRTPIGNTVAKIPFFGLLQCCIDPDVDQASLGPVTLVNTATALGPLPPHPRVPVRMVLKTVGLVLGWWLRDRNTDSCFFDASGTPKVVPTVLDAAQREALRRHPRA
jgi:Family of unknown function (DUF6151)